jgi:hypothetical protein
MASDELAEAVAEETQTDVRTVRKVMLAMTLNEPITGKVSGRIYKALKKRKFKPKLR